MILFNMAFFGFWHFIGFSANNIADYSNGPF